MVVQLDARLEAVIRKKIESGKYPDGNAVIREALRLLDEHEQREHLRSKIDVGLNQIARGEIVPFTPELVVRMKREAKRLASEGKTPSTDVCP
jgi:antitoxin ParD1/3/4